MQAVSFYHRPQQYHNAADQPPIRQHRHDSAGEIHHHHQKQQECSHSQ
ncbi:hypothetical protein ECPA49_3883, partial [Escherichia coli PA49]